MAEDTPKRERQLSRSKGAGRVGGGGDVQVALCGPRAMTCSLGCDQHGSQWWLEAGCGGKGRSAALAPFAFHSLAGGPPPNHQGFLGRG